MLLLQLQVMCGCVGAQKKLRKGSQTNTSQSLLSGNIDEHLHQSHNETKE